MLYIALSDPPDGDGLERLPVVVAGAGGRFSRRHAGHHLSHVGVSGSNQADLLEPPTVEMLEIRFPPRSVVFQLLEIHNWHHAGPVFALIQQRFPFFTNPAQRPPVFGPEVEKELAEEFVVHEKLVDRVWLLGPFFTRYAHVEFSYPTRNSSFRRSDQFCLGKYVIFGWPFNFSIHRARIAARGKVGISAGRGHSSRVCRFG